MGLIVHMLLKNYLMISQLNKKEIKISGALAVQLHYLVLAFLRFILCRYTVIVVKNIVRQNFEGSVRQEENYGILIGPLCIICPDKTVCAYIDDIAFF